MAFILFDLLTSGCFDGLDMRQVAEPLPRPVKNCNHFVKIPVHELIIGYLNVILDSHLVFHDGLLELRHLGGNAVPSALADSVPDREMVIGFME